MTVLSSPLGLRRLSGPSSHLLLQGFLLFSYFSAPFRVTISSCRTFQSHERVRSSGLRRTWPIIPLVDVHNRFWLHVMRDLGELSGVLVPHVSHPATLVVQKNNNSHLDDLRRYRWRFVASNYPSPAIPSSPLPTFETWLLSIRQSGLLHLFPKSTPKVLCLSIDPNLRLYSLCQQQQQQDTYY